MKLTVWGARGSIASSGPDMRRYGGNTACVDVSGGDVALVLDAGTGLRPLGMSMADDTRPIHIMLTHLHMDHIQGLGFFRPLFAAGREVHIWGPASTTLDLRSRLTRYFSPPLFPVRIRDVEADLELHDVPASSWRVGDFEVFADGVIHPGPTVGYRIALGGRTMAYLPDHEPALGGVTWDPEWTSGHALASGVDLLLHDAQYTSEEHQERIGWGHSSVAHAAALADLAGAHRLVLFHHDPDHRDDVIDRLADEARDLRKEGDVVAAAEGMTLEPA